MKLQDRQGNHHRTSAMTGLILLLMLLLTSRCFEPERLVIVKTGPASEIGLNTYAVSGELIDVGENGIHQHGFCWSKQPNPDLSNGESNHLGEKTSTGSFSSTLEDLELQTTYYVKAYAIGSNGEVYGEAVSFTTSSPGLPSVTTQVVATYSSVSAVMGGEVTDDGGSAVTVRGICWNTTGNPTISGDHLEIGSGTGTFDFNIGELDCGTTYFVRAYATNAAGTAYGEPVTFTTDDCPTSPTVVTAEISDTTEVSAVSGGEVTDDGNAEVTVRGVCWSTLPEPTINDDTTINGSGTGVFVSEMTGLSPGVTYYVRAYAVNSEGIAYGQPKSFTTPEPGLTVEDVEGTVYKAVQIGTQIWMAENLRVTHYPDNTSIPYVSNQTEWSQLTKENEAYCWYDNNSAYKDIYGALYTWAAATKGASGSDTNPSGVQGVCPDGWHLPSDEEWKQLESYLGLNSSQLSETSYRGTVEGGKLKEEETTHWADPNVAANNETEFTALPGGFRTSTDGTFNDLGTGANFWTTTEAGETYVTFRYLGNDKGGIGRWAIDSSYGLSVRCVKD